MPHVLKVNGKMCSSKSCWLLTYIFGFEQNSINSTLILKKHLDNKRYYSLKLFDRLSLWSKLGAIFMVILPVMCRWAPAQLIKDDIQSSPTFYCPVIRTFATSNEFQFPKFTLQVSHRTTARQLNCPITRTLADPNSFLCYIHVSTVFLKQKLF